MARRKGIRDTKQLEVWNKNHERILRTIHSFGSRGCSIIEIQKETGIKSRTTIYGHLKNESEVGKYGQRYYTSRNFLKKKLEDETEDFKNSLKPLETSNFSHEIMKKLVSNMNGGIVDIGLSPRDLSAERMLWVVGTKANIWCKGLKEIDEEIFYSLRKLISTILKKANIRTLPDSKIFIGLSFDLTSAIPNLMQHRVSTASLILSAVDDYEESVIEHLRTAQGKENLRIKTRNQISKEEFLKIQFDKYIKAAWNIVRFSKG